MTEYKGVQLIQFNPVRMGPLTSILSDLRALWRTRKGHDVVYMLGYGSAFLVCIPRLSGARVWVNPDGIEWKRSKWPLWGRIWLKGMEWISMRWPDRVIADAEGIKAHLQDRHSTNMPISVVPYGAPRLQEKPSTGTLDDHGLEADGYHLIVCRLEPENSVHTILEAHHSAKTSLPLIVVGDIENGGKYSRSLRRLGGPKTRFIGTEYDPTRLFELRFHCRAYLHGHTVGGTNPSLLEAMAAGNAVIAHDNVFNREVLGDTAAGWFTDKMSATRCIDAFDVSGAGAREISGDRAKNRVEELYSWDSIAAKYERLLSALQQLGV